jgi:hypothetical protein
MPLCNGTVGPFSLVGNRFISLVDGDCVCSLGSQSNYLGLRKNPSRLLKISADPWIFHLKTTWTLFFFSSFPSWLEPVSVNLYRSPGIDSQPGGPVQKPYLTYRPARLHRLAESVSWNRFLGSLNINKFGLCMLASAWRVGSQDIFSIIHSTVSFTDLAK